MGRDESTAPAPSRSGTRQSFLPPAPIPVLGLASPSSQKRSTLSFSIVSALFGKNTGGEGGAFVLPENSSKNAAAPASGEKKEMGQARKPVPQILDGLALGREAVLGQQMHGHLAEVPDDAEPGEDLQRVIGDVNLPPEEPLARRSHEVMMVVVPPFADRQQRQQPVVFPGSGGRDGRASRARPSAKRSWA